MWRSVISFSAVLIGCAQLVGAGGLPSVDEALASVYPGCEFERDSLFLTEGQLDQIGRLSGVDGQRPVVTRYRASKEGKTMGVAYTDTHRVRTLPESLLVALDPENRIVRIEVVAFREPHDYLPPEPWYRQFKGESLDNDLDLQKSIRPITGATLTARATTDAARRILALHAVVAGEEP